MREEPKERALLLGVKLNDGEDFVRSMEELANLAVACDMEVEGQITQNMERPHSALYMGKGKLSEVKAYLEQHPVDVVIFDRSLSPSQLRNLEQILDCAILDRTSLILEIFADRRRIEKRMAELRRELDQIAKERETQRRRRQGSGILRVALVGYTNAGKSTLMNHMLDRYTRDDSRKVLEKDMLFATLDTTVRRIHMGQGKEFLLSDTVGFIHQLPTGLVKAFRSTLEEAREADLLLHVLDYSDESCRHQKEVTEETLKELGAGDIPVIYVYNKADLKETEDGEKRKLPKIQDNRIYMSAKTGEGIPELADMIWKYGGRK